MKRRYTGVLLLLVGSELFGMLLGHWFFGLFLKTVPPVALSTFNASAAHVAFILYGLLAGLAVFVWAGLATVLARFFKSEADEGPASMTRTGAA